MQLHFAKHNITANITTFQTTYFKKYNNITKKHSNITETQHNFTLQKR